MGGGGGRMDTSGRGVPVLRYSIHIATEFSVTLWLLRAPRRYGLRRDFITWVNKAASTDARAVAAVNPPISAIFEEAEERFHFVY